MNRIRAAIAYLWLNWRTLALCALVVIVVFILFQERNRTFLFLSFRQSPRISFPLGEARREVEKAITSMNFSIIQARWFMEVWLSPALVSIAQIERLASMAGYKPGQLGFVEVVARFEKTGGRSFNLDYVLETTLRAQFEQATDSMQKSFAALMLGCLYGDAMNMASIVDQFGIKLTSVDEYARSVLGNIARA